MAEIVNYTPDYNEHESGTYFFVDTDNKYVFINWSSDVKKGIERHMEKIKLHKVTLIVSFWSVAKLVLYLLVL